MRGVKNPGKRIEKRDRELNYVCMYVCVQKYLLHSSYVPSNILGTVCSVVNNIDIVPAHVYSHVSVFIFL